MARVIGVEAFIKKLEKRKGPELIERVGRALLVAAGDIKTDAQVSITANSAGGHAGGKHQHIPSAPGEPPNNDTGFLADHIEAALVEPLRAEVTSNAPYAAALEYGTSKIAERPYMRPAAEKNRSNVAEKVRDAINSLS